MRNILSIILVSFMLLTLGACSEIDFESRYPDPSKTSTVSPEKLMTGVFKVGNDYTMPWYWRYFTFETQQIARFAQTLGWVNGNGMYLGMGDTYNDARFKNFYSVLAQYRVQESVISKMEENEKPSYEVFSLLSRIFIYDHLNQIVDLWGDVPFSKACYLPVTSDIASSYASYDKAEDLYKLMLTDLKEINNKLAVLSPSALTNSQLKAQDYINGGDILKWRKYCNSLRLRIACRASSNGPLTAEARAAMKEIIENPSTYPVVEKNSENIRIEPLKPDLYRFNEVRDGFESWTGACNRASKVIITNLTGDPRLEVMFDPNREGNYEGIDPLMQASDQDKLFNRPTDKGGNFYSAVDTATFSRNADFFPGIIFTASEVDFIKAEAMQKGYVAGDAQGAFEAGVVKSINFHYDLNSKGTYRTPVARPSDENIAKFATNRWNAYTSKEVAIGTQKWLHFSIIQMVQAWSEVRRTGIPALSFIADPSSTTVPNVPSRLLYTTNERNYNTVNYKAVQSKDKYDVKLFWAK